MSRSDSSWQPAPGARAAVRDLELTDYEALFASRTIYTGVRDDDTADGSDSMWTSAIPGWD